MDVVSLCPLRARGFVWQARGGAYAQTVVVKATFALAPGESALAPEQEEPREEDVHWNGDPAASVAAPSDGAPYKPRAEVMLVGHAYAPGKQPARALTARLVVGELDKAIEVWCDRGFRLQDGQLLEGPRFLKMPLRWERAAGGPETPNPVGLRFDAPPDMYGMVAIPNLQPPGIFVSRRSDTFAPAGLGPIAPRWPGRAQKLGGLAGAFPPPGWEGRPLPEGLDFAYFQAAPPDQQVEQIRPNERIVLENLHPEHARLSTSLPGVRPKAVVERATGEREEVALVADTLLIDTDRGTCVVVWRGRVGLRHAAEAGRIAVSIEEKKEGEREESAGATQSPDLVPRAALPFLGGDKPPASSQESSPGQGALAALRAVEPAPLPAEGRTLHAPMARRPVTGAIAIPPMQPPPPPPPLTPKPAVVEPVAPPGNASAWGSGSREGAPAPTVGQLLSQAPKEPPQENAPAKAEPEATPIVDEALAKRGWKPIAAKGGDASKGPSSLNSAVAASDAAAQAGRQKDGAERAAARGYAALDSAPPQAVIELLWYDPSAVARIRRQPGWKEVLLQLKGKAFEDELSGDSLPAQRHEVKDRRDVAGLLGRGEALDLAGIEAALANAVTEDGTFVPPLVLVAGELAFPFDELETLKATLAALSPLAKGDKLLEETLETTKELFGTPWLKGASGIAEGLTAKLEEVFGKGNRVLPPRYLEGHRERMLLEQRAYQKRTVLGKRCIRSLLRLPGAPGGLPVYLPESLGEELPACTALNARLIADARMRADQQEEQGTALRVLALGRVISLPNQLRGRSSSTSKVTR